MKVTRPVRQSLPRQIADEIEKGIREGQFRIGSRIPPEPELIRLFNVSRNTVREAVQSLIHAGVLEARQGDGTYVLASGPFEATMYRRLDDSDMSEIDEVRRCLERDIVRLAAEKRDDSDIAAIRTALEKRNAADLRPAENTRADMEFHTAIAKACHNRIFYDLYRYTSEYIAKTVQRKVERPDLQVETVDMLHSSLFEAILEQDCEKAEKTLLEILNI